MVTHRNSLFHSSYATLRKECGLSSLGTRYDELRSNEE